MYYKFVLPLPPTLNQQIDAARGHWAISAKLKRNWAAKIKSKLVLPHYFPSQVWQQFTWFVTFANDPDNVAAAVKYINDVLVDSKVLTNDNLTVIQSPWVHHYQKKGKKRESEVIVEISDYFMDIKPAQFDMDDLCPF